MTEHAGNALGELRLKAGGKTYRLHLGMSVIADLQEEFGDRLESVLAPAGDKLPDLKVMHAVFLGALQRYHAEEADRWLVDDLIAENQDAWARLVTASSPDSEGDEQPEGNGAAAA